MARKSARMSVRDAENSLYSLVVLSTKELSRAERKARVPTWVHGRIPRKEVIFKAIDLLGIVQTLNTLFKRQSISIDVDELFARSGSVVVGGHVTGRFNALWSIEVMRTGHAELCVARRMHDCDRVLLFATGEGTPC